MGVWKRVVSSLGVLPLVGSLGGCGLESVSGPEVEIPMNGPTAVAVDADGSLYVADRLNNRVRRIDRSGAVTTVAGSGRKHYDGDGGPAIKAALNEPDGVALDSKGNLYIIDSRNLRIRRVDPSGTIATVAGTGDPGDGGDGGPATEAQLLYPQGLAIDSDDNLYNADTENGRVRRIDHSGTITTFAGIGDGHFGGDGSPAVRARLDNPTGLAVGPKGNLYIADTENHRIRRIDRSGTISTVAGTGVQGYGGDGGQATAAQLDQPSDVALDSSGNVYVADTRNNRVRQIDPSGTISTVAGNGEFSARGDSGDGGPADGTPIRWPMSVEVDSAGNLLIVEASSVRLVDPSGTISTVAGRGGRGYRGDGGPATEASLSSPRGIAADSSGNIYIADSGNHRVRRIGPSGTILTVAGTGEGGYSGDGGPATEARLRSPTGVAIDSSGTLYIADMHNTRVRSIDSSGRISTVAYYHRGGAGGSPLMRPSDVAVDSSGRVYVSEVWNHRVHRIDSSGDLVRVAGLAAVERGGDGGPAVEAELHLPHGLAFDHAGNLYVSERAPRRIRRIDPSGIISTVAGIGASGPGRDSPRNSESALSSPSGIAVDTSGNLFVAESPNHRVRRIDPSGVVSTVAGTGRDGYDGDGGPADRHALNRPTGVAVDSMGNLFVADSANNRIRKIAPGGTISTLPGAGRHKFGGDGGPADQAALSRPSDVAVDSSGNLLIADTGNRRVRLVDPSGTISTLAGVGYDLGNGEPLPYNPFTDLSAVAVDASGNLYFAEVFRHRIWKISSSGTLTMVAGTGTGGYSGDGGPAVRAELSEPRDVAVDSSGILYIADQRNYRVRRIDASGTITTVAGPGEDDMILPGSAPPSIHQSQFGRPESLAVDSSGNLYVLVGSQGSVLRIDTSGSTTVVAKDATLPVHVWSEEKRLAVDSAGNVYVADKDNNRVLRIDESGAVTTVAGLTVK